MASRREFLKSATALGIAGITGVPATGSLAQITSPSNEISDRAYWLGTLQKIGAPVLENLSQRQLKKMMPVEAHDPANRAKFTHLEAFGRLIAGIAPWLAAQELSDEEAASQKKVAALVRASMDAATDPHSPDFMNFNHDSQPVVDAAFLALGILRAPSALWQQLDARVQRQVIAALKSAPV